MKLDNSFDFEEFEKKINKPKVPEETVGSLANIFSIATSLMISTPVLVGIFVLLITIISALVFKETQFEFDYQRFIVAASNMSAAAQSGNPNVAVDPYVNEVAEGMLRAFLSNTVALVLMSVFFNIFFAGIAANAKASQAEKLMEIIWLVFSKIIPLTFAIIIKSCIIMVGFFLCLIPGILFWLGMLLLEYVMIFENKGFMESWNRSNELMANCKSNFLTFISVASLVILPIYIGKFFYNFDTDFANFLSNHAISSSILVSLAIDFAENFIYGIYFCGCCLLYIKRSQIFDKLEANTPALETK